MQLPNSDKLDIGKLCSCFNDVTNSYKFYWFLAILDSLRESREAKFSYKALSMKMIELAWYPLNFYKLSFGKQDGFKGIESKISEAILIDNTSQSKSFQEQLKQLDERTLIRIQNEATNILQRWVSFRFLRPFFKFQLHGLKDSSVNKAIKVHANTPFANIPYHFYEDGIIMNEIWVDYFNENQSILRGFVHWNLLRFLHKNNPNAIGLSEKLFKPNQRKLSSARKFWGIFLAENRIRCIYSHQPLDSSDISLDHFIPWSYMAHDKIWNIIPTTILVNSSKSNSLPCLGKYLESFTKLQFDAVSFHLEKKNQIFLEDYYSILGVDNLEQMDYQTFHKKLHLEISTHYRNAKNLGFAADFILPTF